MVLLQSAAFAQSETSRKVNQFVLEKYDGAEDLDLYEEDEGFIVYFEHADESKSAWFDQKGAWIRTEKDVDEDALPVAIQTAVRKKHPQSYLEAIQLIENNQGRHYLIQVGEDSGESFRLTILLDGKIALSEKMPAEDW